MRTENKIASDALDALHGARGLPIDEAVAELRSYLNMIDAAADAKNGGVTDALRSLASLIHKLESHRSATDDDWQEAIDAMVSFANETI